MLNFLKTEYTINVFGWIMLVGAFVFLVLAFTSFNHWRHKMLERRMESAQQKTGFLGKPLMQFIVIMLMVGSIATGVYLQYQKDSSPAISEATRKYQLSLDYKSNFVSSTQRMLEIEVTPSVADQKWGQDGDQFDIFINIIPNDEKTRNLQKQVDFFELNKSASSLSKVTATIQPGNYKIKVVIKHNNTTFGNDYEVQIP